MASRWGTHYEAIPHDNCYDPKHCDCECRGCAPVKIRNDANPREAEPMEDRTMKYIVTVTVQYEVEADSRERALEAYDQTGEMLYPIKRTARPVREPKTEAPSASPELIRALDHLLPRDSCAYWPNPDGARAERGGRVRLVGRVAC